MMLAMDRINRPRQGRELVSVVLSAALLLVVLGAAPNPAGPVGPRARARQAGVLPDGRPRPKEMDFSAWNALLAKYVRGGRVDYAAWKKDGTAALDTVLARMVAHPYTDMLAHEPRLAFLINAYNAYTIRAVLDAYPVAGVKDIPGFFDKARHPLAGSSYTLDEIEKTLIKGRVDDKPEYHFALVCGARGGPPLRGTAYLADSLSAQFGEQLRPFLADTTNCHFDAATNILHVSEIFKWHASDFERGDQTIPLYVAPVFTLGVAMRFMREEPTVEFIPFDWRLNDAAPAGSPR